MANENYLESIKKQFLYYKQLADKTISAVPVDRLNWQFNEESNSIAMIMQHIAGNMLSRFTDFLTSDGEKEWRNRDEEFEQKFVDKAQIIAQWDKAWDVFLTTITQLQPNQLEEIIYIRNEGHTVMEAINRQLAHYPYHIGQIVFLGKMIKGNDWESLSIPKGNSAVYNQDKFDQPKKRAHFTDSFLPKKTE